VIRADTLFAVLATLLLTTSAAADLQLCNRMSYVVEAAIGIEDKGAVATRGWFRLDPGQCRAVLQGQIQAENLYVHGRALPVYGTSPLPQSGHADLCVADGNFIVAGARSCRSGQRLARFTAIRPSETEKGLVAYLAEDAEYTDEQARDAGIQRLLTIAGYDATPIDGLRGAKTEAALVQFQTDNKLSNTSAARNDFFDLLIQAAQTPGPGFTWCNETAHPVMAAIGVDDKGAVITRGWYRVEPGKCLRPEVPGRSRRLFSFAEAVDSAGQVLRRGDRPLAWGGSKNLCTRDVKFELNEHSDCAARGLSSSGFATVDLTGHASMTIRFKE
jgi:uncharacterized membrane protein